MSEHLLPLEDHLVELLQAGLQALAIHGRAALRVVQRGRAQLVQGQHLLHLQQHKGFTAAVRNLAIKRKNTSFTAQNCCENLLRKELSRLGIYINVQSKPLPSD